jgi:uncharacterized RDD family membrane protein YckC
MTQVPDPNGQPPEDGGGPTRPGEGEGPTRPEEGEGPTRPGEGEGPTRPEEGEGPTPPGYPAYPPPNAGGYDAGLTAPEGVPAGMYLEPVSGLVIPEGVQLASIGRRIGAFFLSIVLFIITLGIGYIIWGLIVWGRGQTPALQVLGMRCWRPGDTKVANWPWMALREIVGRFIENILGIITLLISFILMVTSKQRKCLHDLIAGTVVFYDPNKLIPT